ncbi:CBM96 family carbohydrate-binding protein [Pedobacter kyonggii]|uniref:DNRLRE domain-containing protein n=1 Tax=Pedobacter kyonggii TaxID=1926871 RepID=A0A4Q9HGF5_9SPHI|nr:DNRLRE domain-containing protein [Pedobacter kyonggii]TBO44334.1 DNRLRE domain-containing protein [Pedobacter kyonggii]
MKNLKLYLKTLFFCTGLLVAAGCSKFELLKNEDSDGAAAGANLKAQTIKQFLLTDHSTDLTELDLFSAAVKRAGLVDLFGTSDSYTSVFLTNPAMKQLLATIGYASVDQVPPIILKNLLEDLIIKGKLKSTDIGLGESKKMETINGNFIYYSRSSSSSDQYILTINQNSSLSSTAAVVRSQDLEFSNGVAQVTAQFTFYRLLDEKPDDAIPGGNVVTEKINVTKDVYIRGGNGNNNANFNDAATMDLKAVSSADATVGRIGVMQFPLTKPGFGDKIGAAKMFVYVYNTGLTPSTIYSFSAHLGENKDWIESTITWNNAPTYNSVAMSTIPVPGATVGWVSFDVTSAVSQLYANNGSFINVFLRHNVDNFIKLRPREFSSGSFAAYIAVTSPPITLLKLGQVSPLNVSASKPIVPLTIANLQMTGTDDKNITYTIKQVPTAGYLVKYGVPLSANASFSQTDIAKGAVKYLYGGTGNADKIVFEARDHNGGYFANELSLDIVIN